MSESLLLLSDDEPTPCTMAPRNAGIDHCILELVAKVNESLEDAGLRTVASCCGHGHQPLRVDLSNGTAVLILNYDQAQKVSELFPNINGEPHG